MNVKKSVDYSTMFAALDVLMTMELSQMDLYYQIGKTICDRPEKGAAVAAAEYLQATYSCIAGFSPRNVRRMREFYRTYENSPQLLDASKKIGWTQNVLIFEKCTSEEERCWYIHAVSQFNWSKQELTAKIECNAYLNSSVSWADPEQDQNIAEIDSTPESSECTSDGQKCTFMVQDRICCIVSGFAFMHAFNLSEFINTRINRLKGRSPPAYFPQDISCPIQHESRCVQ